jgi:hypothetical protein
MVVQLSRMSCAMPDSSILPPNCATRPFKYRSSGGTKVSVSRDRTDVARYAPPPLLSIEIAPFVGFQYAYGIPSRLGHLVEGRCFIRHCGVDYFCVHFLGSSKGEIPRRSRQSGQREPLCFQFLLNFF